MAVDNSYKLKLGIFVSAGLIILIGAIFYIGTQKNFFSSTIRLKARFSSVSGLMRGNNVRFSGINVGVVDKIRLTNDTTVLVEMLIEEDVQQFIKTDAKATIASEGLMGDRIIVIYPGTSSYKTIADKGTLQTVQPIESDEIIKSLSVTSKNAEVITAELAGLVHKLNTGQGAVTKLLTDEEVGENLSKTMENLKEGSEKLNENMDAAKNNFLLRGYFKKKAKEAEKKKEQSPPTSK